MFWDESFCDVLANCNCWKKFDDFGMGRILFVKKVVDKVSKAEQTAWERNDRQMQIQCSFPVGSCVRQLSTLG